MGESKMKRERASQVWFIAMTFEERFHLRTLLAAHNPKDDATDRNSDAIEAIEGDGTCESFVTPANYGKEEVGEWAKEVNERIADPALVKLKFTVEEVRTILSVVQQAADKEKLSGEVTYRIRRAVRRLKSARAGDIREGEVEQAMVIVSSSNGIEGRSDDA